MFGFQEVLRRGKKKDFFFLFNLIMKNAKKIKNKNQLFMYFKVN